MVLKVNSIIVGKHKCGFCAHTASHHLCPSGVLNGNQTQIVRCPCDCERAQEIRCLRCNARNQDDINPDLWECYDRDACDARIEHRLNSDPTIQMIRSITAKSRTQEQIARAERREKKVIISAAGVAEAPKCLHCGEATKGGKFLPGHDSSFLSAAAAAIRENTTTLADTQAAWESLGVSEALRAKLAKRVSA